MATTLTAENKEYIPKAWEKVPCPFCAETRAKHHEFYGPKGQYEYVKCVGCELVYSARRPIYDEQFVTTAYELYDTDSYHVRNRGELSGENRAFVERYKTTLRQLEARLGKKGKILDIGCNTGLFLLAAKEEGWLPYGIDVSSHMVEHCNNSFGLTCYVGNFEKMDLADGPFDVIYSSHVIEHIPNPNEWMEKFKRDLAPGGLLCLNIPNQYSVDRVIKRSLKKVGLYLNDWQVWRTPDHLYEPHVKPMLYLMKKHGFNVRDCFTYSKREKPVPSRADKLMHNKLRWGSKLRIIAEVASDPTSSH